jgi:hypothetical protein
MASFGKKLKKVVRTIHKYEGRVLKVAAPVAGAVFLGPVGAAAGTALGSAASYYGEKQGALASGKKGAAVKKAGRRGLKSGLIIGGIVTGGAAVLSIAGGVGAATSSASALGNIFGATKKPAGGTQPQYGDYGQDSNGFVTDNGLRQSLGGGSPGSSGASGFPWGALTGSSRTIGATGAPTGDRDFGQIGALFHGSGTGLGAVPPIVWIGGALALLVA